MMAVGGVDGCDDKGVWKIYDGLNDDSVMKEQSHFQIEWVKVEAYRPHNSKQVSQFQVG